MLVSGMIIGTAFTLFIVPSIYMSSLARERPSWRKKPRRGSRRTCLELAPAARLSRGRGWTVTAAKPKRWYDSIALVHLRRLP